MVCFILHRNGSPPRQPIGSMNKGTNPPTAIPLERLLVYLGLFLALFAFSGHLYVVDEIMIYKTTMSILEEGDVSLDGIIKISVQNPRGEWVCPFPPGQTLLSIPLYLLGRAGAALTSVEPKRVTLVTRSVVMWLNGMLYAVGLLLVFRLAKQWGANQRQAVLVTLALAVGSIWWVYSQTLYRQVPSAVLTILVVERLAALPAANRFRQVNLIGGITATLILFRMDGMLMILVIVMGLLWRETSRGIPISFETRRLLECAVIFGWFCLAMVLMLIYNTIRSGNPLDFSTFPYGFDYPLIISIPNYIWGLHMSIFLYSPPLLLVPLALPALWRRNRRDAAIVLSITIMYFYVYGKYNNWGGGVSWGPRFTLVETPLWFATLGPWLAEHPNRWKTLAVGITTVLGFPIQILGIVLDQLIVEDLSFLHEAEWENWFDTWWLYSWDTCPIAIVTLMLLLGVSLLWVSLQIYRGLKPQLHEGRI